MKPAVRIPLLVVLYLLVVGLAVTLKRCQTPTLPESQCSLVYQHYAHLPGIEATFVKGYPLNDTIPIDVTLLQATTDSAWQRLRADFGDLSRIQENGEMASAISCRFSPKKDYSLPMDTSCLLNNDFVSFSFNEHIIGVFHLDNQCQCSACLYWHFNAMVNNSTLSNIDSHE